MALPKKSSRQQEGKGHGKGTTLQTETAALIEKNSLGSDICQTYKNKPILYEYVKVPQKKNEKKITLEVWVNLSLTWFWYCEGGKEVFFLSA